MSEKKDDQLFFVQSEATSADDEKKLSRTERRKRPLRSLSHLYRDPVISGNKPPTTAGRLILGADEREKEVKARRLLLAGTASDSSDDEEEFDVGSRFSVRRRQETKELAKAVHRRLKKSTLKPVMRDVWADEGSGEFTILYFCLLVWFVDFLYTVVSAKNVPDEHYLRVTRKLSVKVACIVCTTSAY